MILKDIIENVKTKKIVGPTDIEISDIVYDSGKVVPGSIFVCLRGSNFDGHNFISTAIKNGAKAILSEADVELDEKDSTVVVVDDTREALASVSSNFFCHPSKELTTIAITGTKGKTTTSCMIKSILEKANFKVGLIGTLGIVIGDKVLKTNNTTPESYETQKALREMVKSGCKYAVLEASSIGLKTHRLDGIKFDYGVFTNFSKDHIGGNEHKSMEEYLECKGLLFKKCKSGILNIDDPNTKKILTGHTCSTYFYGFKETANIICFESNLISKPGYLGVHFKTKGSLKLDVDVSIPGKFSVYNALAAISVCKKIGVSEDNIKKGLNTVKVKGRVEAVDVPGDFTLLIDYAHNAVSMENVLTTLREYNPKRIVTLFGAGGNRPKIRRYEMGEISGTLSDLSVITEDNSRNENVLDIIDDIKIGINKTNGKYVVISNRRDAIKFCIENAQPGDIIVLAGKGHEDYQEIGNVKYHFDEREIVNSIIKKGHL